MEGLWKFALEKSLNVQSLMSCCDNLEDRLKAVQMMEDQLVKLQEEVWDSILDLFLSV